jgi:hypothetical protein
MKDRRVTRRSVVFAIALAALIVPVILQSAIVYLKDGSELRGEVVSFEGDTLVFDPSFGGRLKIYREDILRLIFDESTDPGPPTAAKPAAQVGPGSISIVFKHDKVNSKIAVKNKTKSRERELVIANWIQQLLIVGSDTVYSQIDTTMDKTIYKGHEKELKNTIHLEDIRAKVDAGVYKCVVVVRNLGADDYESEFREGPLDMVLVFETVGIYTNQTTTLQVAIKKGFMRMGSPRLVQVQ